MCAPLRIADLLPYDGALLTGVTVTGPIPGTLTTVYDNFFRASQIGVNGSNIAYAYDADGLLTGAGNLTLARDPGNGLVTGTALGQIATSQSYDSFGRVSGFTAKQGATVLFDEQYQRDNAGNLTKKTVTLNGQTSVYDYAYDPAGRLTDVTKDGTATGHFEYDANGNRTLAYGIAASYDDQDRLISFGNAQYAYTANGELQKITGATTTASYAYDVSGNLKHVDLPDGTALDYLADGRNRRVGKKVNGTLVQGFLYQDQLKPAAELNGQGNVISRFVYAGKANVPDYMVKGGVTYRIVSDQLGSVRLVINSATGQIAQRIDYDEWGNVLSDSNPGFQPFGFAGGLYATVCLYSGAGTTGHVGIGVNSSSTVGYAPLSDSPGYSAITGTPGNIKPDKKEPEQCKTIKTSADQDRKMSEFIAKTAANPGTYTLGRNNCTNFVRSVLNQAGIFTPISPGPR